ncbi:TPA: hypothetical protein SGQ37_002023 [Staphylococcus aureus]|uniref:hypothetical protein n=1 Tax=Staphylococcus aureus TaxID=1280 RepID=UPI000932BD90|nr:hypothetical protein [Staphylococcus aureus]EKF1830763.1 hypothetical protein [Staphylococcus aureus]OJZ49028.1 hypothetical protein BJR00_10235 [Staphylococcus aureus]HAR4251112.1 hypothetical protein [Staphylococcus aureus]HAR4333629.1 hypothetical protein [Staphylococcus aureus]HAR5103202.1 hypothetical protein [Staphylococcus aureus]
MKHTLLRIANELNELILHSDARIECQFARHNDETFTVYLLHFDDRYELCISHLSISTKYSDEEAQEIYEQMKRVIAGEELINE